MIGVVTLNPCVDKTLFFDTLPQTGIHTARRMTLLAGGKGNNVARVLRALGAPCRCFVPIAGENGRMIRRLLCEEGMAADFVETSGQSRVITTIVDNDWKQLAVKDPGPELTEREAAGVFTAFIDFLNKIDLLCLSGTVPCRAMDGFYRDAIDLARQKGVPVLLDADGEALRQGLAAGPDWAKPNIEEIGRLLGRAVETPAQQKDALQWLVNAGVSAPILSLGAAGALTIEEDKLLRILPPEVKPVNPVGSGDSFVAGLLYGIAAGMSWRDSLAWATAAGAANAAVWEAACLSRGQIEPLLDKVRFIISKEEKLI